MKDKMDGILSSSTPSHLPPLLVHIRLSPTFPLPLTLKTLTSVCIFSILFSIHFLQYLQGAFVLQQQFLQLVIMSFILPSLMFEPGVIL